MALMTVLMAGAVLHLSAGSRPEVIVGKGLSAGATKNPEVVAPKGMVASAHPLASQAGVEILKAGGNAVDAAVATAFAIGVAEPNATGIGGEGMMVIYLSKKKTAVAIDYRSASPAKAAYDKSIPALGHTAVAVPGTVAGLALALERYGTMKLPQVMAPAIKLASEGFTVSATLGAVIAGMFDEIVKHEELAKIVAPTGLPLEAGSTLKNTDLAESLKQIAAGGRDVFYRGAIADRIAAEMAAQGGFITKDDLAAYKAIERPPVTGTYRGYTLLSAPPPVAGLSLVEVMQILENFPVSQSPSLSATRIHVAAEAMKRGFIDMRDFIGDPAFVTVPIAWLTSKPFAKSRAGDIDPAAISKTIAPAQPPKEPTSTTHLSVVDKDGNMVALTQTISDFFGSKVVIAGTGIILNNEMKNFSREGPNALAPGKRMRTTIAPTLLLKDGKAFATLGTPGGSRILTTMTLLIQNLIDYKMGIQEAIEPPRFFPDAQTLMYEPRLPEETVTALTGMGYTMRPGREFDMTFGGAQGIVIDPKTKKRIGGADPRRDGAVIGY
jgi:gamma-glutamyltranspeptidase / glutathione hydrolase